MRRRSTMETATGKKLINIQARKNRNSMYVSDAKINGKTTNISYFECLAVFTNENVLLLQKL